MRVPALGAVGLLCAALVAGCGGSSSGPGTRSTSTTSGALSPAPHAGPLGLSPAHPRTTSELTFTFTAPTASGVHGSHVIGYSLSVTGPAAARCVGAHEAGSPSVVRGARVRITVGPAQLGAPWCAGDYSARVLELSSAHCTGSAPCPQYVRVVGIIADTAFLIRRG
jgi:hypothetical protein